MTVALVASGAVLAGCGSGNTTTVTVTNGQQGGASSPSGGGSAGGATVPGDGGGAVSSGSGGKLVLMDSGFSQYSSFGTRGINYALLVRNTSSDSTFDKSEVTISFLNKAGTSVASDDTFLDPIPAGQVGALVSDVLDVPAGAKANRMVVEISDPLDWISQPGQISGKVVAVNASNSYGTYEVKT